MNIAHIIKKPIISEKSIQRAGVNKYTFEVHSDANKAGVAEAVASLFGVTVLDVKIFNRKGKTKRIPRTRLTTQTSKKKIAIVTIDPKQTIDLFTQYTEEAESKE